MELNTIKPSGTWGQTATAINDNFSKTNSEVEKLKASLKLFKGFFLAESSLKAAVPSPRVGDYAYVGATYPGVVYNCTVHGTWVNTGRIPNIESVNLADYAKKEDTYAMVGQLNTMTFDVSKLKGILNPVDEPGFHFPDATGKDVIAYTDEGFDAAKVAKHFIELILSIGIIDKNMLSDDVKNMISQSELQSILIKAIEPGFHFSDATGKDVMAYTDEGFDVAKVAKHFIELLNSEGVGGMDYEVISNEVYNF